MMSTDELENRRHNVKVIREIKRQEAKGISKPAKFRHVEMDPFVQILIRSSTAERLKDHYFQAMSESEDEDYSETFDSFIVSLVESTDTTKTD